MTDDSKTTARRSREDVEAQVKAAISRQIDRSFGESMGMQDDEIASFAAEFTDEVMRALIKAGVPV